MRWLMGVDGGGSAVRAVVTDADLTVVAESYGESVNPNAVGREVAAQRIQQVMRDAIQTAGLDAGQVAGVTLGVAGAARHHPWAVDWLHEVAVGVVPQAVIVPSSDHEIALVGAQGQRRGVLLLAGTGSLAYGVNAAGQESLVGATGYLLGDEGGGYWLGNQALRAAVRYADGRGPYTTLYHAIMATLGLDESDPLTLIRWVYGVAAPVPPVAALAPLVLAAAAQSDAVALGLVTQAAQELALAVRAVRQRLDAHNEPVAFVGSLLINPNALSVLVCELLGLEHIPLPRYSAVIGAALMARQQVG